VSTTSPSQCVTIDGCDRRWWFEKVAKLRLPDSKPQHYGHALHFVCGAHLGGQPLPKDWAEHLTNDEVERCLELRDRGIRKGVLRAREGLLIEHDFTMRIKDDDMHGVIDVYDAAGVIEDHKGVSAAKWAKTETDLRDDIPMMIYGGYALSQNPALAEVTLRHNQFIEDILDARAVEVTVSRAEVKAFWGRRVMPLLARMDKTRGIEQWENVPGQPRLSAACTKYKGCPFAAICHGGLPMDQFALPETGQNGAPF